MSKIQNIFAVAAIAIFKAHSNLEEIYVTSDGQGFTEKTKADNNAAYLKDKTIKHFERGFEQNYTDPDNDGDALKGDALKGDADLERDNLVEQYKELFGENPGHNWKAETIQKKIDDKKAETTKNDDGKGGDAPQV